MVRPVSIDRAISRLHRESFFDARVVRVVARRHLSILATAIFVSCFAATPFVTMASAIEANVSNDSFSALRDYAQLISADRAAPNDPADATVTALREFAQQVGANQSESIKGLPKLADADNLLDFLRQGGSSSQPSAAPKGSSKNSGPVAGGTKPSAPVEASFVGAKVCVTCHATQAEAFSHTLMGRIGKTQKGKFDCENCHGPGSAHVKAGGGRGVGGIIYVPAGRSIAHRRGKQRDLPDLPSTR